jgi:hypothetical protein
MTKLSVAFRNFPNALKKKTLAVNLISLFRPASFCSNTELIGNTKLNYLFTCKCRSRRLFRVTLEISRAECNIDVTPGKWTATDTCIGYHVTRFESSQKVILYTRYVSTCVKAGGGSGREKKKKKANLYFSSLMIKVPDYVYVLG